MHVKVAKLKLVKSQFLNRMLLQPLAGLPEGPVITYMTNLYTQTTNNNQLGQLCSINLLAIYIVDVLLGSLVSAFVGR